MKIPLVGSSKQEDSLQFDAERTINLYAALNDTGREPSALVGRPGLYNDIIENNEPGRGLFTNHAGNMYLVAGADLFCVKGEDSTLGSIGTLDTSSGYVTFADNGLQLGICDGTYLYTYTYATFTFAKVTDVDLPSCGTLDYLDGYFIVNKNDSGSFYISALYDGRTWDALDFATAESSPDDLLRVKSAIGQLFLFGKYTSEVWTNSGASDFPFERVSGGKMEIGILGAHTVVEMDNTVFWVGRSKNVNGAVYRANGFTPQKISNRFVERTIQDACKYSETPNLKAYSYEENGHLFYCITGSALSSTLCYDVSTGMWHERTYLDDDGNSSQHIVVDIASQAGNNYACSRLDGTVFRQTLSAVSDYSLGAYAPREIVGERIFQTISNENTRQRYNSLEILMETGVGLESGRDENNYDITINPVAELYLSGDGGHTFKGGYQAAVGRQGKYNTRVIWRRLGIYNSLTIKVRMTDSVRRTWIGAYLN